MDKKKGLLVLLCAAIAAVLLAAGKKVHGKGA